MKSGLLGSTPPLTPPRCGLGRHPGALGFLYIKQGLSISLRGMLLLEY